MAGLNRSLSTKLTPKKLQRPKKKFKKEEINEVLSEAISSCRRVPETVNSLLSSFELDSEEPQRKKVFEVCINALNDNKLSTSDAKEITGKLLFEVDKLQGDTLIALAELVVQGVKDGLHQALELFPKLLAAISSKKTIKYWKEDGHTGEVSGPTEKHHLLNSLCGCRWEAGSVQHISHVCQDIPMDEEELRFLMEKILRMMKNVGESELPPLVYQLLVLSGKGHRSMVLEGVKVLFYQLDMKVLEPSEEVLLDSEVRTEEDRIKKLLQTEGTVILHLISALKQDPALRKEFVKSLKVSQGRLSVDCISSFSLALVLSMIRMHIFEDAAFSFLKEVVLKSFKDEDRRRSSKWLQEMYVDAPNIEKMLISTVNYSVIGGWDHVVEGLFTAGLLFMEHFAPKSSTSSFSGPQYKACCLGRKLLWHTFKAHAMVRQELFSQLLNRILTNAAAYADHYIQLLADIVGQNQLVDAACLSRLKDTFSSLSLLPPSLALQLLQAVLPLLQFSVSVRDALLLVLRKSLFSRKMESRKIAVGAYLILLQHFTVLDAVDMDSQFSISDSQSMLVSAEIHGSTSSGHHSANQVLCLEILGILRRALTKQSDVRVNLYEGLRAAFFVNPKLAEPIMELLLSQFERYYDSSGSATPPVRLDKCVDVGGSEVTLLEPLAVLVHSLQSCVCKYLKWLQTKDDHPATTNDKDLDNDRGIPEGVESAQEVLVSTVSRMIKSDPEDFELDKSSDFSPGSSVGRKNRTVAALVAGVYEALMEFTFLSGDFSQESCEQMLKLYQCYKRISDIVEEKGGASGGASSSRKSSTSGSAGFRHSSCLSLECVGHLLKALLDDQTPNHQVPLKLLRESNSFTKYVMAIALQKIRQLRGTNAWGKGTFYGTPARQFKLCCRLARVMFKQIESSGSRVVARKDKGKSLPLMCLEGFSELLHVVVARQRHMQEFESSGSDKGESLDLKTFLSLVGPSSGAASQSLASERIVYFIRLLQRLVVTVVDGSQREWSMKDSVLMLSVVATLAEQLDQVSSELNEVYVWVLSLCQEKEIEDVQVAKSLVSLFLSLNCRVKGSVKTLVKVTKDVHYHLGDIDEDIELVCDPHFVVVSQQTVPAAVLPSLYSHLDWCLVDADWLVTRLKTELAAAASPVNEIFEQEKNPVRTQQQEFCSSLCSRLVIVLAGLSELVQTLLTAGPNTDSLLKLITQFYTVAGSLTKYCIAAHQETGVVLRSFRKLINAVGTNLSQQVYCFLTFVQTCQPQPSGGGAAGKSKKGGKGKGKGASTSGGRSKASVTRETKYFPTLVFSIEQFEKNLILLGKKAKENLMESFKRSMARDFRIDLRAVESVLNEGEEEEEEIEEAKAARVGDNEEEEEDMEEPEDIEVIEDSDESGSLQGNGQPPSKRLKRR